MSEVQVRLSMTADVRNNPSPDVTRLAAQGWPDGWPVPQKGAFVDLPDGTALYVQTVSYFPLGDTDAGSTPFVYVVLTGGS